MKWCSGATYYTLNSGAYTDWETVKFANTAGVYDDCQIKYYTSSGPVQVTQESHDVLVTGFVKTLFDEQSTQSLYLEYSLGEVYIPKSVCYQFTDDE